MTTIWKYTLGATDHQRIEVPGGAKFRHAGHDPLGQLAIWLELNTDRNKEAIDIYIHGTGHMIPQEDKVFLASVVLGSFVWHIYSNFSSGLK